MCGILGGWVAQDTGLFEKNIRAAMLLLKHRGPDDQGYDLFTNEMFGHVILAHTRLSIIDLSPEGHQPMHTLDERYSIVFNGEIYNYRELRDELSKAGYSFRSNSDTEVLLTAWVAWGQDCLERLIGMFSFVIYDKHTHTLTCVRDAFGMKPFFYLFDRGRFLFASEQRSLLALRGGKSSPDWQRSYDYLVYNDYDSEERTFIEGVTHLLPGHMMQLDMATASLSKPVAWWCPSTKIRNDLNFSQATDLFREQFLNDVRLHLRSDVPLGVALSGGLDSSSIACVMRYLEPDMPIHTFSYIAADPKISEEYWVDRVNQHINAIPHKLICQPEELVRDLDDLISSQGEPFGGTSIYAQYRLFKLVKEAGITVTLDGQGADELLAGYNGYPGVRLLSYLEQGKLIAGLQFLRNWQTYPGRSYRNALAGFSRVVLAGKLYAQVEKMANRNPAPSWLNAQILSDSGVLLRETRVQRERGHSGRRMIEKLAYDAIPRSLPCLLRHGDRNSMQFSVESRLPFLTIAMTNFLFSLPENYLISDRGETKYIMRRALQGIVPDEILNRRDKVGFTTPQHEWLRGMAPTLRGWLEECHEIPFLHHGALLAKFDEAMNGKANITEQVWRWVNFAKWHQQLNNDIGVLL